MDSKEDYRDLLLLESSPLNTPLDENALPGGSKEVKMKNDSGSMEETMSHQPQTNCAGYQQSRKEKEKTGKENRKQTIFTHWKLKSRELRSPLKNDKNTWAIKLV